jgi:L-histidine N-alpha-methyltransferase
MSLPTRRGDGGGTATATRGMSGRHVTVSHLSEPRAVHDELVDDALAGLTGRPKSLPPKYFYDARGSELFERITRLPEYYATRAETAILEADADDLVAAVRPEELVELGSGSSRKTRLLLEAMHAQGAGNRYVPLDVSEAAVRSAAAVLAADYPWLRVDGLVGDFLRDLPAIPRHGTRLLAFLGSTIGNLDPAARRVFLKQVAAALAGDDRLLLGVDLVKDVAALEAAYDDAAGVTAAFNRNVLAVLNRELGGDLPVDAFAHVARWDPERSCVDLYLRATRPVTARLAEPGLEVTFAAGEELHTEMSCKFTRAGVEEELDEAGLTLERWLTDQAGRFALVLAARAGDGRRRRDLTETGS